MGSSTLRTRPSPPHTCVTTPKSTQVASCVEGRTSSKVSLQGTKDSWRGVSSSDTSGRRECKLFITCVSLIIIPPLTSPNPPRSAWKPLKSRRKTVSRCLHQTASTLHSLCHLSGITSRGRGGGNTETYCQPPCNEVEGTLLMDLRVRKGWGCDHFRPGDTPLHPGWQGSGLSNHIATPPVGRRRGPIHL